MHSRFDDVSIAFASGIPRREAFRIAFAVVLGGVFLPRLAQCDECTNTRNQIGPNKREAGDQAKAPSIRSGQCNAGEDDCGVGRPVRVTGFVAPGRTQRELVLSARAEMTRGAKIPFAALNRKQTAVAKR